ncbi:MAG: hypothetical protein MZV64_34750 [Ignavibacteriales bacterium]|nr:hypothetical protein [Ignavibacteriales bacterium]
MRLVFSDETFTTIFKDKSDYFFRYDGNPNSIPLDFHENHLEGIHH